MKMTTKPPSSETAGAAPFVLKPWNSRKEAKIVEVVNIT